MKLFPKYVIICVIGICGCSKSNSVSPVVVSESKFLIANVNSNGFGVISTYEKPDAVTTDAAYTLSAKGSPETIADFQIYNDKVYMVRSRSGLVEVANLSDLSQVQTLEYAKPIAFNAYKHIGVTNNRIFVGDRDFNSRTTTQNTSFLKVITLGQTKIDSIGIAKNGPITAVAVSSRYVYVSGGVSPQTVFVIDANTLAKVASIPISGFCTEILIDKDNNILVFYNGRVTKFSGTDYSVLKDKAINGANVNVENDDVRGNTGYALDVQGNIVYFLSNAPQPASAPYLLKSYNLNTDVVDFVSTQFITAVTIAYDSVDQQILLGNYDTKGVMKFLTLKGEVKSQFTISGEPEGIRVDQ